MSIIISRLLRSVLCSRAYYKKIGISAYTKVLYLTFDDGPHEVYTSELLDLLMQYNVKATFFVNGECLTRNYDICKRIIKEGHRLGNHTLSHKRLPLVSKGEMVNEVLQLQTIIDELQDYRLKIFRPPWGLLGFRELFFLKKHGYNIVLWTFDSSDSCLNDKEELINRITNGVCNGSIILFHDDSSLCIDVLQFLLPYWLESGFTFSVIPG